MEILTDFFSKQSGKLEFYREELMEKGTKDNIDLTLSIALGASFGAGIGIFLGFLIKMPVFGVALGAGVGAGIGIVVTCIKSDSSKAKEEY